MLTLVRHSLRRHRALLGTAAVVLVALQLIMITAARALQKSGAFQQLQVLMPSFLEQWTNMMASSFRGLVLFGYSHPVTELFLVAVAIAIGTEPVGEIETKFVDLLMARPLRRSAAVVRTLAVLITATLIAIASMLAGTFAGLHVLAPPNVELPQARVILSLAANLALLILAWGGIALAIASVAKRRATAAGACGFLAFAAFVLDYLGRFWDAAKPFSRVSPFHYFDPFAMIGGATMPPRDALVLAAIFVVTAAVANVAYVRRDL